MALYLTPDILRAARALAGLDQVELSKRSGMKQSAISKCESGGNVAGSTLEKLQHALERSGIEFLSESEISRANGSLSDYLRAARMLTGMAQLELALKAGLDQKTISRAERGLNLTRDTVTAIKEVLQSAGIEFKPEGALKITSVSYRKLNTA